MATVNWIGNEGNWADATGWNTGAVTGGGDDAVLAGNASGVQVDSDQAARSLTQSAYANLSILNNATMAVGSGGMALASGSQLEVAGATLTVAGTLANRGIVQVGISGSAAPTALILDHLDNTGTIIVYGGTSTTTISVADAAPTALTGTWDVLAHASVTFGGGSITDIAQDATLGLGTGQSLFANAADPASNSALTALASIEGMLELRGGTITTQSDLDNSGTMGIGDANWGIWGLGISDHDDGGTMVIGGMLTNSGTLMLGNGDETADSGLTATSLVNTGFVQMAASAGHGTALALSGVLDNEGTVNLMGAAPASITGITDLTLGQDANTYFAFYGAGSYQTLSASGSLAIAGGAFLEQFDTDVRALVGSGITTFDLLAFALGELTGVFRSPTFSGQLYGSQSFEYGIQNVDGALVGLIYDDAAGVVRLAIAAVPATATDNFSGPTNDWSASGNWDHGGPVFYSSAVISGAQVHLAADATVAALTLQNGGALAIAAGGNLSLAGGLSVDGTSALIVTGGKLFEADSVQIDGTLLIDQGAKVGLEGDVSGSGTVTIAHDSTLNLSSYVASGITVNFAATVDGGANTFLFRAGGIANPATAGDYDQIMDFNGAGDGYRAGEDIIEFSGFSSAARLTFDAAATSSASDPTAHYYTLSDGAYQAEIIVHYAGSIVLKSGDYGFLAL